MTEWNFSTGATPPRRAATRRGRGHDAARCAEPLPPVSPLVRFVNGAVEAQTRRTRGAGAVTTRRPHLATAPQLPPALFLRGLTCLWRFFNEPRRTLNDTLSLFSAHLIILIIHKES